MSRGAVLFLLHAGRHRRADQQWLAGPVAGQQLQLDHADGARVHARGAGLHAGRPQR